MKHCRPKIVISFTIVVWSIFLLQNSQTTKNEDTTLKWFGSPSMEAFENYEYLHKYTDTNAETKNENHNLPADSFIDASNYGDKSSPRILVKRETTAELSPQIFKFGVEDAREPDEATKELIRKHRAREFQEMDKKTKRTKRRAPKTEPRLIKFDISDAREPDDATKELIRQSRAREMKNTSHRAPVTTTQSPRTQTKKVIHKRKRARRSAQMSQPQYIRFELADAKDPTQNMREMIQNMRPYDTRHRSINQDSYDESNETGNTKDSVIDESKKIFFFQPVPAKSKRVSNSLPIEVKKIIDLMIRDSKAQAYYKYVNANQEAKLKALEKARAVYATGISPQLPAANNLVNLYPEPAYVQKLVPIPIPVQTISVNALPPPSQQHPTGPAPHPAIVSAPANNQEFYHSVAPIQTQAQPGTAIYHQPPTYLKVIPAMTQVFKEVPTAPALPHQQIVPQFSQNSVVGNEITKPYQYGKVIPLDASYRYGKRLNFYPKVEIQQTILTNQQGTNSAIEADPTNQSQQKLLSQNDINKEQQQIALKNNQEFQDLSSLIGKSPTDQIHGLAYLLAKEMQRNKRLKEQRPQDNTSPILFHPEKNIGVNNGVSQESGELPTQPELPPHPVPEPLPQTYPPSTQHGLPVNHVTQDNPGAIVAPPPPPPPPTSYNVVKNLGLSPNYEGIDQFDEAPKVQPDVEDGLGLQYASKYAFGYRVRDFHSGNDFGHKQNRDLDGVTRGQYHILLPDGRVQNVIYHADDTGFHADVSFETGHH